jgi:hypothetical protein
MPRSRRWNRHWGAHVLESLSRRLYRPVGMGGEPIALHRISVTTPP